jgi:predicted CoA-binding protein
MAEATRKTVAVVGASTNRQKFGNLAVRAYRSEGWDVYPVNRRATVIEGLTTYANVQEIPVALDRVTVYLPPRITEIALEDIARKGTRELFLNPGAADDAVMRRAAELGLEPILACSIVDIGRTPDWVD